MTSKFKLATELTARDRSATAFSSVSKRAGALGKQMKRVGRNLSVSLTAPVSAAGFAIGRTAFQYEKSMNLVNAVTGATAEEYQSLRDMARELGRTTQFSASDSAGAMAFLGKASLNTQQILQAMPNVLDLAAAGELSMAEAAQTASQTMKAFGLEASEMANVADLLANAAVTSNTDVLQLKEALKFVGPVARGSNVALTDTVTLIGMLSDNGVQAEMAGTSLRGMLSQLAAESPATTKALGKLGLNRNDIKDQNGDLLSLIDILKKIRDAGGGVGDVFAIFGQRAGTGAQGLLGMIGEDFDAVIEKMDAAKEVAGRAGEIRDKMNAGIVGMLATLGSVFEEAQLTLSDSGFMDAFKSAAEMGTRFLKWVIALPQPVLAGAMKVALFAAALGPVSIGLGTVVNGASHLATVLKFTGGVLKWTTFGLWKTTVAVFALGKGLLVGLLHAGRFAVGLASKVIPAVVRFGVALMANPIGLTITAVAGLTAAGIALYKNWDAVAGFFSRVWDRIKSAFGDGIAWIMSKVRGTKLGSVLEFLGFDLGEGSTTAQAPPVDTSRLAQTSGLGRGQDGRARVQIDVNSGREAVRVRATEIDDVDLELVQGVSLGVVG